MKHLYTLLLPILLLSSLLAVCNTTKAQVDSHHQKANSSEATFLKLTFINGIHDCPSYGIEGDFISEMISHFKGKTIETNREKHYIVIEIPTPNKQEVIQNITTYAKDNHYPESHLFEITPVE